MLELLRKLRCDYVLGLSRADRTIVLLGRFTNLSFLPHE
jgi:hypothetical protein